MVRSVPPFAAAMIALCVSAAAVVDLFGSSLHQLGVTTTTAEAVRDLLPLVAMLVLLAAVASIYRQLHQNVGTEVAVAVASAAVGLLQYLLQDDGTEPKRPCAVREAAAHVLPCAATATFFLGMALVFVHGSGAVLGAGEGPAQTTPVRILTKLTLTAAAGVIALMALGMYG